MESVFEITPYQFLSPAEAKRKRETVPEATSLARLAIFFKLFGDSTRLRILFFLKKGPLSVGDLAALLEMTPSATSHQLKLLKLHGLVRFRRCGKTLFYELDDDHIHKITTMGLEHIKE